MRASWHDLDATTKKLITKPGRNPGSLHSVRPVNALRLKPKESCIASGSQCDAESDILSWRRKTSSLPLTLQFNVAKVAGAATKTHSHGATPRALRHVRSPQRVHRNQDEFARRHSESASTRRGFAGLETHSRGATARALQRARSP